MNKVVIETKSIYEECETCGTNYEEGGILKINDEVIFEYEPTGSCFSGSGFNVINFLVRALLQYADEIYIDDPDFEEPITKETIDDFRW